VDPHHPVCAASVASRLLITGAATPPRLRRGASRVILSANVEHRTATAAFGFDDGVGVGQPPPLRAQLAQGLLPLSGQFQFLRATCAGGAFTIESAVGGALASMGS